MQVIVFFLFQPDHPVLLAGKSAGKSKWTTFTEPQEEEEVVRTNPHD